MLEVEHTPTATIRWRNGNEVVAGAASESFARWLHHRQAGAVRQRTTGPSEISVIGQLLCGPQTC